jgi:signal transduction histidine kinase
LKQDPELQIVATSHSPYLLDQLQPEEVRLTTIREDGSSVCGSLVDHPEFERWKDEMAPGEMWIQADTSHLMQTFENLLCNARDATFEMRNAIRQSAHSPGMHDDARRQALLQASAWRGTIAFRTRRNNGQIIVEVIDNGIGMTEEVRRRCTETHFSTKRDNAIFQGYSAGMGLGLSFVTMILQQHGASLEIESRPQQGALFRVRFAAPADE